MFDDRIQLVPEDEQKYAPLLPLWHQRTNVHGSTLVAPPYPGFGRPKGWVGASGLGGCTRELSYRLQGIKQSDPMEESGFHATGLGSLIHLAIQSELMTLATELDMEGRFGVEVPWSLDDDLIASEADIVDFHDSEVVDIKSANTFAFKMKYKEGPARGNILQIAAAMRALDKEWGRLVYVATAPMMGRDVPKESAKTDRVVRYSEWRFPRELAEEILQPELDRYTKVREFVAEGKPVPRFIPGAIPTGARIVEIPEKFGRGIWQLWANNEAGEPVLMDNGDDWMCGYCDWREHCKNDNGEATNADPD